MESLKTEGRYKVGVLTPGDVDYAFNALRFDTLEEAESYGVNLAMRWTAVRDWRVVDTSEPS
jgi:hypothetical protein